MNGLNNSNRLVKPVAALLAGALLLAACGTGESANPMSDLDPDDVILTVTEEGGFAPVEWILGRHPRFVLQADGRIYSVGFITLEYPGRMILPIMVGTIDEATMGRIMELVQAAGLPDIDRVEDTTATGTVADATTTVITYFDGSTTHVLSVYALGFAAAASDQITAAAELVETLDRAVAGLTDSTEYRPTKVEIRTGDQLPLPDEPFRNTQPWPLAMAPDELPETGFGWRCVVVEGPPATDLLELFGQANQATVWEYEGTEYPLIARGLMPGEAGCA